MKRDNAMDRITSQNLKSLGGNSVDEEGGTSASDGWALGFSPNGVEDLFNSMALSGNVAEGDILQHQRLI